MLPLGHVQGVCGSCSTSMQHHACVRSDGAAAATAAPLAPGAALGFLPGATSAWCMMSYISPPVCVPRGRWGNWPVAGPCFAIALSVFHADTLCLALAVCCRNRCHQFVLVCLYACVVRLLVGGMLAFSWCVGSMSAASGLQDLWQSCSFGRGLPATDTMHCTCKGWVRTTRTAHSTACAARQGGLAGPSSVDQSGPRK